MWLTLRPQPRSARTASLAPRFGARFKRAFRRSPALQSAGTPALSTLMVLEYPPAQASPAFQGWRSGAVAPQGVERMPQRHAFRRSGAPERAALGRSVPALCPSSEQQRCAFRRPRAPERCAPRRWADMRLLRRVSPPLDIWWLCAQPPSCTHRDLHAMEHFSAALWSTKFDETRTLGPQLNNETWGRVLQRARCRRR
jgi:hypothetical protein